MLFYLVGRFIVILVLILFTIHLNVALKKEIAEHAYLVVFFHSPKCPGCAKAFSELELAQKYVEKAVVPDLKVVSSDSAQEAERFGVKKYPGLVFFRNGYPLLYNGDSFANEDLLEWLEYNPEIATKVLTDESFEHLTQASTGATTGDWFVMFYRPSCDQYLAIWEAVASNQNHRINVAKVDISNNKDLIQRFKIIECRSFIYFRLGTMYKYTASKKDVKTFIMFAEGWFKNERGEKLKPPLGPFDLLVEEIADKIKVYMNGPYFNTILLSSLLVIIVTVITCYTLNSRRSDPRIKKD